MGKGKDSRTNIYFKNTTFGNREEGSKIHFVINLHLICIFLTSVDPTLADSGGSFFNK